MWGFPMAFVAILSHNLHWNVLLLVLSASGITIRTRLWMDYRAWLGMAWKHTIWETLVVLDYFGASRYDWSLFSCHCISLLGSIADHCWSCQWRPQVSCQGLDRPAKTLKKNLWAVLLKIRVPKPFKPMVSPLNISNFIIKFHDLFRVLHSKKPWWP